MSVRPAPLLASGCVEFRAGYQRTLWGARRDTGWKNTCAASWPSCASRKPTTITVGSWQWSPSSSLADRIHRLTVTVAGDQPANRIARQRGLREETDHRAGRNEIGVVLLSVGGNQNHLGARQTGFQGQ